MSSSCQCELCSLQTRTNFSQAFPQAFSPVVIRGNITIAGGCMTLPPEPVASLRGASAQVCRTKLRLGARGSHYARVLLPLQVFITPHCPAWVVTLLHVIRVQSLHAQLASCNIGMLELGRDCTAVRPVPGGSLGGPTATATACSDHRDALLVKLSSSIAVTDAHRMNACCDGLARRDQLN